MSKLSKEAFAITAMCEETKRPFGITVNPDKGCYAFTWAFKMKDGQAKREGYDKFEEPLCLTKTSMAVLIVELRTSTNAVAV